MLYAYRKKIMSMNNIVGIFYLISCLAEQKSATGERPKIIHDK